MDLACQSGFTMSAVSQDWPIRRVAACAAGTITCMRLMHATYVQTARLWVWDNERAWSCCRIDCRSASSERIAARYERLTARSWDRCSADMSIARMICCQSVAFTCTGMHGSAEQEAGSCSADMSIARMIYCQSVGFARTGMGDFAEHSACSPGCDRA